MPQFGRYRFQPSLALTIAMLIIVSGCIRLGFWQLDRAAEKARTVDGVVKKLAEPVFELKEAPARDTNWQYRRVQVDGQFDPAHEIWIDNQILQGLPGYHLVVPFKISGTETYLLVNRGWLPWGRDRSVKPEVSTPMGTVTLQGRLDFPMAKPYGLKLPEGAPWTWRWPFLDLPRFRQQTSIDIGPYVLLQESPSEDGLVRNWPVSTDRGYRHTGYAVQWFAFALIGIGVYIKLSLRPPGERS